MAYGDSAATSTPAAANRTADLTRAFLAAGLQPASARYCALLSNTLASLASAGLPYMAAALQQSASGSSSPAATAAGPTLVLGGRSTPTQLLPPVPQQQCLMLQGAIGWFVESAGDGGVANGCYSVTGSSSGGGGAQLQPRVPVAGLLRNGKAVAGRLLQLSGIYCAGGTPGGYGQPYGRERTVLRTFALTDATSDGNTGGTTDLPSPPPAGSPGDGSNSQPAPPPPGTPGTPPPPPPPPSPPPPPPPASPPPPPQQQQGAVYTWGQDAAGNSARTQGLSNWFSDFGTYYFSQDWTTNIVGSSIFVQASGSSGRRRRRAAAELPAGLQRPDLHAFVPAEAVAAAADAAGGGQDSHASGGVTAADASSAAWDASEPSRKTISSSDHGSVVNRRRALRQQATPASSAAFVTPVACGVPNAAFVGGACVCTSGNRLALNDQPACCTPGGFWNSSQGACVCPRYWNWDPSNSQGPRCVPAPASSYPVVNLALGKVSAASSIYPGFCWGGSCVPAHAFDGDSTTAIKMFHSAQTVGDAAPWLAVDLGGSALVVQVNIYLRLDCCAARTVNAELRVGYNGDPTGRMQNFGAYLLSNTLVWRQPASQPGQDAGVFVVQLPSPGTFGRFVSLQNRPAPGTNIWDQALQVIEMEVYGVALGAAPPLLPQLANAFVDSGSSAGAAVLAGRAEVGLSLADGAISLSGSVDSFLWSDADAAVYCRQLGYGGGGLSYTGAVYGAATLPYMLTAVSCGGGEAALGSCAAQPLVRTTAWPAQDAAGVLCYKAFDPSAYCARAAQLLSSYSPSAVSSISIGGYGYGYIPSSSSGYSSGYGSGYSLSDPLQRAARCGQLAGLAAGATALLTYAYPWQRLPYGAALQLPCFNASGLGAAAAAWLAQMQAAAAEAGCELLPPDWITRALGGLPAAPAPPPPPSGSASPPPPPQPPAADAPWPPLPPAPPGAQDPDAACPAAVAVWPAAADRAAAAAAVGPRELRALPEPGTYMRLDGLLLPRQQQAAANSSGSSSSSSSGGLTPLDWACVTAKAKARSDPRTFENYFSRYGNALLADSAAGAVANGSSSSSLIGGAIAANALAVALPPPNATEEAAAAAKAAWAAAAAPFASLWSPPELLNASALARALLVDRPAWLPFRTVNITHLVAVLARFSRPGGIDLLASGSLDGAFRIVLQTLGGSSDGGDPPPPLPPPAPAPPQPRVAPPPPPFQWTLALSSSSSNSTPSDSDSGAASSPPSAGDGSSSDLQRAGINGGGGDWGDALDAALPLQPVCVEYDASWSGAVGGSGSSFQAFLGSSRAAAWIPSGNGSSDGSSGGWSGGVAPPWGRAVRLDAAQLYYCAARQQLQRRLAVGGLRITDLQLGGSAADVVATLLQPAPQLLQPANATSAGGSGGSGGSGGGGAPPAVVPAANLAYLDLSGNALTGLLPALPVPVINLNLSYNALSGDLRAQLTTPAAAAVSLNASTGAAVVTAVAISNGSAPSTNNSSGSSSDNGGSSSRGFQLLPASSFACTLVLDLGYNQLGGQLPAAAEAVTGTAWRTLLDTAVRLDLSGNRFEGTLPPDWAPLLAAMDLVVSRNPRLSGGVPAQWLAAVRSAGRYGAMVDVSGCAGLAGAYNDTADYDLMRVSGTQLQLDWGALPPPRRRWSYVIDRVARGHMEFAQVRYSRPKSYTDILTGRYSLSPADIEEICTDMYDTEEALRSVAAVRPGLGGGGGGGGLPGAAGLGGSSSSNSSGSSGSASSSSSSSVLGDADDPWPILRDWRGVHESYKAWQPDPTVWCYGGEAARVSIVLSIWATTGAITAALLLAALGIDLVKRCCGCCAARAQRRQQREQRAQRQGKQGGPEEAAAGPGGHDGGGDHGDHGGGGCGGCLKGFFHLGVFVVDYLAPRASIALHMFDFCTDVVYLAAYKGWAAKPTPGVFMALIIAGNLVGHWVTRVVHSRRHRRHRHPQPQKQAQKQQADGNQLPGFDIVVNVDVENGDKGDSGGGGGATGAGAGAAGAGGQQGAMPPCELAWCVLVGLLTSPVGVVIEVLWATHVLLLTWLTLLPELAYCGLCCCCCRRGWSRAERYARRQAAMDRHIVWLRASTACLPPLLRYDVNVQAFERALFLEPVTESLPQAAVQTYIYVVGHRAGVVIPSPIYKLSAGISAVSLIKWAMQVCWRVIKHGNMWEVITLDYKGSNNFDRVPVEPPVAPAAAAVESAAPRSGARRAEPYAVAVRA
ncbi:hypothetical protein HXX76_012939 [Chlamydomonas incerta]|uniref:SRCR domain-containing protein n=1 Tax=Chlamydomonas incerta TaxID=51695 RepID=A0A835VSX2_CHLIN|nr:hypothetical protein HXX76_012939 [Chlamydomonas incerta]|eukprot:KAG2426625.1 hypothetical protein HXX76_012939 [Chlamydomonas incerta]